MRWLLRPVASRVFSPYRGLWVLAPSGNHELRCSSRASVVRPWTFGTMICLHAVRTRNSAMVDASQIVPLVPYVPFL